MLWFAGAGEELIFRWTIPVLGAGAVRLLEFGAGLKARDGLGLVEFRVALEAGTGEEMGTLTVVSGGEGLGAGFAGVGVAARNL